MARGALLNAACHTARNQSCCGDAALGELFWAERAKQGTVLYGAVRPPSSLGLTHLMRQHLPPNPRGKRPAYPTFPQADRHAPRPELLRFCTSAAALVDVNGRGRKASTPQVQRQGESRWAHLGTGTAQK